MLRSVLLCLVLCTATQARLIAQRAPLDSATAAKASAQCGHVADDSVWADSLWKPGPQTVVSVHAYGLEVPDFRSTPPAPEYPAHLRRNHVQGRVVATGIIGVNGQIER